MKTLTVHQPWANFIVWGFKSVEIRTWQTPYRGWLAIHSAPVSDYMHVCHFEPIKSHLDKAGLLLVDYPGNMILAVARLVDCQRIAPGNIPPAPERDFGNYEWGRWMWFLEDVRPLPAPIPAKGYGPDLWNWVVPTGFLVSDLTPLNGHRHG